MQTAKKGVPEQRVVLHDVSWETCESLLADHLDSSAPRFAFDRGVLEIVSPSPEHEKVNRRMAQLVTILAEEMDLESEDLVSTTFRRRDLQRGFEPDSCFYFENEERIRGKTEIDLLVDPPPDLVIEIDITSTLLNKFPIYARLGVPEIWHYDGERVAIFRLEGGVYAEAAESTALPSLTSEVLSRFVKEGLALGRKVWMREVR